jgi:hypothetical protein
MFIIKPLVKWLTDTSWEDVDLLEHLPKTIAELENKYENKAANSSQYIEQAAQLMQNKQEDTTQLVQQWLKET